ncbi:hypothetical protein HBI38_131810 [Parastagonospora nodorum]|nr:hypothetical protein HBH43_095550 [Parastagonospora nodorum]KAH5001886.1 hypothetical protein HBI77_141570 [Parastagonospora nodorum]KAH5188438.1 hypothetical protein HBH76_103980 [Parastagonospora nodorum]KAH5254448.1 hypothetical protein HBI72_135170 [Parastagonospora nodorum]KAH5780442.1 hypothetical protein HBI16_052640 [Parastagonospora nodorum]
MAAGTGLAVGALAGPRSHELNFPSSSEVLKKIKEKLIHKAKLKQQYAKLKARQEDEPRKSVYDRAAEASDAADDDDDDEPAEPVPVPSLEPHPDRLKMLEENSPEPTPAERRQRRPQAQPFRKEEEVAKKKREEAEARQRAREQAEKERASKLAERERFRKTMAKARGGPNGKRKLGRESTVLLAKAQRIMGKT